MAGITLLLSTIIGKISGLVPDIFAEWKSKREFERETAMLTLQTELQIKLNDAKIQGRIAELDAELEIEAFRAESQMLANQTKLAEVQLQTKTGIAWVDAFNAIMRPTFVAFVMLIFVVTALTFVYGVYQDDALGWKEKAELIWNGSLIGMSIEAVIGFLFGYRSSIKRGAK